MAIRDGVTDGSLDVLAAGRDGLKGGLKIAGVIEGIKDAEDIDADFRGLPDECVDHIIRVVAVADEVLAAEKHHERGLGRDGLEEPDALPRVLIEESRHDVKGCAAPHLKGVEADIIQHADDLKDVRSPHSRGEDGLVAVTQCDVRNADGRRVGGEWACAVCCHQDVLPGIWDGARLRKGSAGRVRPVA